jgi:hypothetical protein
VETEFGLSRPSPQSLGLLLLRLVTRHGLNDSGLNEQVLNEQVLNEQVLNDRGPAEFLANLPKVFLLFSFPPIAASAVSP